MNPQQTPPVPSQLAAVPGRGLSHAPTDAELLELGMLAIEDMNRAEAAAAMPAAAPVPMPAPAPSAPVPAAQAVSTDVPAAAPNSVVTPTATNVQLAPSTADVLAATKQQSTPQGIPAVAPSATPAKARDVAAPAAASAPVDPDAPVAAAEQAPAPHKARFMASSDLSRMDLSANSMQMKGVARLHVLNLLLYLVLVLMVGGIVVGGWYLYQYLKHNSIA